MTARTTLDAASKPDEPALVTSLFARRLAQPIAVAAVRLGISANAVTVAGGLCWVLSLPLPALTALAVFPRARALGASWVPWLAAAVLWCAGYILDVADGSVARMTGTSSRPGFFLDYVFHLLFKPAFLFSGGLGLAGTLAAGNAPPGMAAESATAVSAAILVLAVLSIPANGAAATCAAELSLCEEVARGHLKMDGAAAPGLWLGSDAVSAPAREKRGTFAKTAKTIAAEVASYYLQAPFFALLVAVDLALRAAAGIAQMPCTAAAFAGLSLVLAARIPLRCARESRRLGRATRAGRGGRVAAKAALLLRVALAGLPFASLACSLAGPDRRGAELAAWGAVAAAWIAAAAAETASARLSRKAGDPVHCRYWLRVSRLAWMPAGFASAALCLAGGHVFGAAGPGLCGVAGLAAAALSPLGVVACVGAELSAAAHVFCQDIGKGRLREDSPGEAKAAAQDPATLAPPGLLGAVPWAVPAALALEVRLAIPVFAAGTLALAATLPRRIGRTMEKLRPGLRTRT